MAHKKNGTASGFLARCASIDFGRPELDAGEKSIYLSLNNSITRLVRALPPSAQTEATLLFMRYSGCGIGEDLDFFRHYHAPVWSVIYWLALALMKERGEDSMTEGINAHAMAMFLHSFDDHLVDRGLPASHLGLLVRSQAWILMRGSIARFCSGAPEGADTADELINTYYSGLCRGSEPESLDEYCGVFKQQAATGLIVPMLTAMKCGGDRAFLRQVRSACESFFVAWRLLDDVRDIGEDVFSRCHSAVYFMLSEKGRRAWDGVTPVDGELRQAAAIAPVLRAAGDEGAVPRVILRTRDELASAADVSEKIGLPGLAREFLALMEPLEWNDRTA